MLAILDYNVGNVSSIINMFRSRGIDAVIVNNVSELSKANKIILPGVGHFDYCMKQLKAADFFNQLQEMVLTEKIPVLGVCAGCQMLMEESEEGKEKGLGWIKGKVVKFDKTQMPNDYKIPNMGWTDVEVKQNNFLYKDIIEPRFYFVHSYHIQCDSEENITATANYGYSFIASVQKDNIMGVQFHPEKSHHFGMQLYKNFAAL